MRCLTDDQTPHLGFGDISQAAQGRWNSILAALGLPAESLIDRHGPCPGCGGKDRFRFDDKDGSGSWFCGGGGSPEHGDGFSLLQHTHGWGPLESLRAVADVLGIDGSGHHIQPARVALKTTQASRPKASKKAYALELWLRCDRSDRAIATHPYAMAKGITWAAGAGRVTASGRIVGQESDCIVVPVQDLQSGKVLAVQCINSAGEKQTFGLITGHGLILGNDLDPALPMLIFEGWASAVAWVFQIKNGNACGVVAFGKSNQRNVAEALAELHSDRKIIIMREDDSE